MKPDKEKNRTWDHLEILRRDELIDFLKQERSFNPPTKKQVRFFKWYRVDQKLQDEMNKHLTDKTSSVLAERIDVLARDLNRIDDTRVRLKIEIRRQQLIEQVLLHNNKFELLLKKMAINDKLLEESHKTLDMSTLHGSQ